MLAIQQERLGADHPLVALALGNLGKILCEGGDYAAAEPLYREALAIRRAKLPENHWRTGSTEIGLGSCLTALQRYHEAEPLMVQRYEKLDAAFGASHRRTQYALDKMIQLYELWGQDEKAASYRAKRVGSYED